MSYWFPVDTEATDVYLGNLAEKDKLVDKLKIVRDALVIDGGETVIDYETLRSVPDIWTAHRIYNMMFFGSEDTRDKKATSAIEGETGNPLQRNGVMARYKASVVKQWRAIMTIILIGRSKYNLNIGYEDVTLESIADPALCMDAGTREIAIAVFKARPELAIWENTGIVPFDPDTVRVYYLEKGGKKQPIAISSPTTYLVPAADVWETLCGLVSWVKNPRVDEGYGVKDDFLKHLNRPEAVALEAELRRVAAEFPDAILSEIDKANAIKALLEAFVSDPDLAAKIDPYNEEALFQETVYYFTDTTKTLDVRPDDPVLGGIDPACYMIDPTLRNPGRHQYYNYCYIPMPITEHCRGLLESTQKPATFSCVTNGREPLEYVKVTFRSNGHEISREYRIGEGNAIKKIRPLDIGSAAVWPQQEIESWQLYFAFCHDPSSARYMLEPVGGKSSYTIPGKFGSEHRYYRMNTHSEFWRLKDKTIPGDGTIGFVKARMQAAVKAGDIQKEYKAAFDFGTSSTVLYRLAKGRNTPDPVCADMYKATPICNPERHENDQITPCFIPVADDEGNAPFQTVLAKDVAERVVDYDTLYGRGIFFSNAANAKRAYAEIPTMEYIPNLKWETADPTDTQHFLREAVYFLALDARRRGCGKLQITATYPGAMTTGKRDGYLKFLQDIANEACIETGLSKITILDTTESLAVAKGINSNPGYKSNFCSIDIGGGTTDIFLCCRQEEDVTSWSGRGSSLKIGARDIFLDSFFLNRRLLTQILDEDSSKSLIVQLRKDYLVYTESGNLPIEDLIAGGIGLQELYRQMEALLNYRPSADNLSQSAAELLQNIVVDSREKAIVNMKLRIAYYLGAIAYYTGMFARIHDEYGGVVDVEHLEIQFAGNGSKVIKWISDDTDKVEMFIKAMFCAGMGTATAPRSVIFSRHPKLEVAYGAMFETESLDRLRPQDVIIAGERFSSPSIREQKETAEMPMLTGSDEFTIQKDELTAFLDRFNEEVVKIIPHVAECDVYGYPELEEIGFRADLIEEIRKMARRRNEIKPFFLLEVENCDPNIKNLRREKEEAD